MRLRSFNPTGLVLACAVLAPVTAGARTPIDSGALRLDFRWGKDSRLHAESFVLTDTLPATLAVTAAGRDLEVREFPTAPGERDTVVFRRVDAVAPGARVLVLTPTGTEEIPRSARIQLLGVSIADPRIRVGLSMDPGGSRLSGLVSHPTGVFEITSLEPDSVAPGVAFEIGTASAIRPGVETHTTCGTPDHPEPFDPGAFSAAAFPVAQIGAVAASMSMSPTHTAVVAFDTDAEFVADYASPADANDAIVDFVTALNVIYERDLGLQIVKGETLLRTDAAADPYASSSTRTQLDEVGDWWEANQAAVERAFVALLSGKGPWSGGSCSGAGIAWVDSYCDPVVSGSMYDAGSYSATQVLRCVPLNGSNNTNLIGHELGHNAGSSHTHCYAPAVDNCYNAESGCWGGAVSCPDWSATIPGIAPYKGTIMSYCNFSAPSGAACGSNEPFFHPTVITRIQQSINANSPFCVVPISSCSAGDQDLTVQSTSDNGPGAAVYEACNSIAFGPSYTVGAGGDVTSRAPVTELWDGTTVSGTFQAENVVP